MAAAGRQEQAVRAAAVPSIVYDRGALNLNWFVAQVRDSTNRRRWWWEERLTCGRGCVICIHRR